MYIIRKHNGLIARRNENINELVMYKISMYVGIFRVLKFKRGDFWEINIPLPLTRMIRNLPEISDQRPLHLEAALRGSFYYLTRPMKLAAPRLPKSSNGHTSKNT